MVASWMRMSRSDDRKGRFIMHRLLSIVFRQRLFTACLISLRLGLLITVYGTVLLMIAAIIIPDTVQALPPVQGTVTLITSGIPGTMVIVDDKGQTHVLNLTQQTQLSAHFKPGDKVIAFFSPYGVSAVQLQTQPR